MEQHCFCLDESLKYPPFHLSNLHQEPGHQLAQKPQSEINLICLQYRKLLCYFSSGKEGGERRKMRKLKQKKEGRKRR